MELYNVCLVSILLFVGWLWFGLTAVHSSSDNQARIMNGTKAPKGRWPFIVAMLNLNDEQVYEVFCGGSVLNQDTILTASHCLTDIKPEEILVFIGSEKITEKTLNQHKFHPKELIVHPEYERKTLKNDIGILKLKETLNFDLMPNIRPLCLNDGENNDFMVDRCYVMGWGYNSKLKIVDDLFELKVPILDDQSCAKRSYLFDQETMLCAGWLEGGRDSCRGDSGGPLVCPFKADPSIYSQVGIISFARGCALKNNPNYYTKVKKYLDWIRKYV